MPILFGAGFTVATCLAAGLILLRFVRIPLDRLEQLLFGFVTGGACISTLVFGLCVVHQARTGAFLAIGAAVLAFARPLPAVKRVVMPRSKWIYFLLLASLFILYFMNALAPEVSPDGSGYHLGNVVRTFEVHGFAWDYLSIYSAFPQGMEMLFLVAYSLGGMPAAAMVHFAFLCTLAGLLVAWGRRYGYPRAGLFASVLIFGMPVVGIVGVSAYNDVALATCIYAGFYLIQVNNEENSSNTLILIGLLAGFSFAIKYTGWVALPYAAARVRVRQMIPLGVAAGITGAPWLLRNWIWIGNPLAPFLNNWFPNRLYTHDLEIAYLSDIRQFPGIRWPQVPFDLTLYGAKLPGFLGPVLLLSPLALLALRDINGRKLLLASMLFSISFFWNPAARFLIPGLPFLAMAIGIALRNSPSVLPALAAFHTLLAFPPVMSSYCADWAWRLREMPVRVALGLQAEEPYIRRFVPDYPLTNLVQSEVAKQQTIFSFTTRPDAYFDRRTVVSYESSMGVRIGAALERGENPKALGVDFVLVNDRDASSAAIMQNAKKSGLVVVSKTNATTLYRVD